MEEIIKYQIMAKSKLKPGNESYHIKPLLNHTYNIGPTYL